MLAHLETIQSFVAPVVMVSANGLLCLAFYNRLSALANRIRAMNKERFELVAQLSALRAKGAEGLEPEHLELRIATLDKIGHQLFDRARWIRRTLMSLLVSVLLHVGLLALPGHGNAGGSDCGNRALGSLWPGPSR